MQTALACLALLSLAAAAPAASLVRNPSFETDADGDGVPDDWQWAGDSRSVAQSLALDAGRDGHRCARLACTRFDHQNASSHAMLCQLGVPVTRGTNYRVSLWARASDLKGDIVSIALSDTSTWSNCGLAAAFAPGPEWQRFDFRFRATRTCGEKSRFQIWFGSTGTLWIDDVEFAEAGPEALRPGYIIAAAGHKNLVPNASFEAWYGGWGSAEWDRTIHWGGRMNRLHGFVTPEQGFHGGQSLEIRVESKPQEELTSYFDYYELSRTAIRAPLAANIGWIEVEQAKPYTLSAYMKAAEADTPARLAVRQFEGRSFEKAVRVSKEWERCSLTFTPTARWCYVLAGPDLRKTPETPNPSQSATLWLDAIQLERGESPTAFQPRQDVELGFSFPFRYPQVWAKPLPGQEILPPGAPGLLIRPGSPPPTDLAVTVVNMAAEERSAKVELRLTDFFDSEAWAGSKTFNLLAGERRNTSVDMEQLGIPRGFYRLRTRLTVGDTVTESSRRVAYLAPLDGSDSRFGMNHAYPWPHLLDECRAAGLIWMRDWSLKWQQVEPEKGKFDFTETDYQIDRPLKHGLKVLGLLPFPSANWSSSAPESVKVTAQYPGNRVRVAYAPRDEAEFESYVEKTVAHYKGRITWWQCFNEPLYTDYALPRKLGYDGATYARLVKAFARAARRANPDAKVLAGMGGLGGGQTMADFEAFFAAGGLAACDAVDIHHYPRIRPPEFVEGLLQELNALMDKYGGRKPLWLTEYGYYADDQPWAIPMPYENFNQPLRDERQQAEYAVRWATLCLANGVEKVFYHAGTCAGINSDSLQGVFFEYDGQPHKIYAAQAFMASVLTPTCRFLRKLALGEGAQACLFGDGTRLACVVWAPAGSKPRPIHLASNKLELWDLMGRRLEARDLTPDGSPVYILGSGLSPEDFEAALK